MIDGIVASGKTRGVDDAVETAVVDGAVNTTGEGLQTSRQLDMGRANVEAILSSNFER